MFKTNRSLKQTIAAAAILGLSVTAVPAMAKTTTKIEVSYKDLDLTTMEGQQVLERRLDRAAKDACGYGEQTTGTRLLTSESRSCYKQASSRASEVMASAIDYANQSSRFGG